jgi:mannan endo-1,4-beta-mannosidase
LCTIHHCFPQTAPFVTRSGTRLQLDGHPFYFLGANAYYLMEEAARGDTSLVKALFTSARRLNMTVVRTWGFFDSNDSLNPAVIQLSPGVFNERALHALDFVLWQARQSGIHLVLPLVNNWDDYGGMNQYVRWRMEQSTYKPPASEERYTQADRQRVVTGIEGRHYRVALSKSFGHDDFYTDVTIMGWYKAYIEFLLERVNTFSGVAYKNDPTILAWELANEPRSSDRSGLIVSRWVDDLSTYLKQVDGNHLVGTGEEGFDVSGGGYSISAYGNQRWLFDGTAGVSFLTNSRNQYIDFAGIHLYPQSWGLTNGAGNTWIRDHVRLAATYNKPLVIGEFGVLTQQSATYDSWLTTTLLEDGGGAMIWQLLEGGRNNNDGYGVRCPESGTVCAVLQSQGEMFKSRSFGAPLIPPPSFVLFQNYPNPFNGQTTIAYDLPADSHVKLSVFNSLGEAVMSFVDGFQHAGTRKELLEVGSLPSGAYFYQVRVQPVAGQSASATKKLVIVK